VRPRLLGVLLGLMAVVLLALGVPLATSIATSRAQALFLDRLSDTSRFASIAQQGDTDADLPLVRAELERYDELYGIAAAVVDRDGRVRIGSRDRVAVDSGPVRDRVAAALGGRPSEVPDPAWPWVDAPMVVAEPMVKGGDVIGAVVTVSPTARTRAAVLRGWAVLAIGELLALVGCVVLALRVTRWVLRPVHVLDATASQLTTGRLNARVAAGSGPPELRRLVSSFNQMAGHVESSMEQQRAFVADASHQLRNPLNALLLRLDDLSMRLPPQWQPELGEAAEEGRRLATVLDSLLELARAEHAAAAPERVDVVPLVTERLGAWSVVAQRRGIAVERTGAAHADALVDPVALTGALDVVVDNALKFGPAGSTVTVGVDRVDGEIVVDVGDQGPGLDDEELSRVGDRFWRSRRHTNVSGSGLGLSIARTLLGPSQARIEVSPRDTGGLSVRLRVPAHDASRDVTP
jgi:signal transduction histidine kinase